MRPMGRVVSLALLLLSVGAVAPGRAEEDSWAGFRFLIGEWVNEGQPGGGSASFTLEPDLGGKVLVRRNVAEQPATEGRPAARHEDLMVVYREPGGERVQASYFDNEGHVIRYSVSPLPDDKGMVFVSDPDPTGPRFRLTYTKGEGDRVAVKFEIALPGKADEFRTYVEGTVRRKKLGE
jgi:hypothetical protein